jgi:hypothetical protein
VKVIFFLDAATYLNEDDRNALMRSWNAHFQDASVALNEGTEREP